MKSPQSWLNAHNVQQRYGFAFVSETPVTPEATEALLERIGPIRNTHYGGFYDFVPDLASADTAYTNLALAPHTDTTYFTDPAGLQAFHMLSHEPPPGRDVANMELGGQSLLVDGFKVASEVWKADKDSYFKLRDTPIPWHASGNRDHSITPMKPYPVIDYSDGQRIRWNNDDRGVVPLEDAGSWYRAARLWNSLVNDPKNQYRFQLEPGKVLSKFLSIPLVLGASLFCISYF